MTELLSKDCLDEPKKKVKRIAFCTAYDCDWSRSFWKDIDMPDSELLAEAQRIHNHRKEKCHSPVIFK